MLTIRDIVSMAGGAAAIARASVEVGHETLTDQAVWKWQTRPWGIPERHWRVLAHCNRELTPSVLHDANELVRTLSAR